MMIDDRTACEINYHHNFRVSKGERTYYGGIPDIIQISEYQFVDRKVIEMWLALMDTWCVGSCFHDLLAHPIQGLPQQAVLIFTTRQ